jgi:hypothetical protein
VALGHGGRVLRPTWVGSWPSGGGGSRHHSSLCRGDPASRNAGVRSSDPRRELATPARPAGPAAGGEPARTQARATRLTPLAPIPPQGGNDRGSPPSPSSSSAPRGREGGDRIRRGAAGRRPRHWRSQGHHGQERGHGAQPETPPVAPHASDASPPRQGRSRRHPGAARRRAGHLFHLCGMPTSDPQARHPTVSLPPLHVPGASGPGGCSQHRGVTVGDTCMTNGDDGPAWPRATRMRIAALAGVARRTQHLPPSGEDQAA